MFWECKHHELITPPRALAAGHLGLAGVSSSRYVTLFFNRDATFGDVLV